MGNKKNKRKSRQTPKHSMGANQMDMTPGEKIILQKLHEMEKRLQAVENPSVQSNPEKVKEQEPELTQVNSGEPVLSEDEDGFLFVAPPGYAGSICTVCHMPPSSGCQNGVLPIDIETKRVNPQAEVFGSFFACSQKVEWRNKWRPKVRFSSGEMPLPLPGKVVTTLADLGKNGEMKSS